MRGGASWLPYPVAGADREVPSCLSVLLQGNKGSTDSAAPTKQCAFATSQGLQVRSLDTALLGPLLGMSRLPPRRPL